MYSGRLGNLVLTTNFNILLFKLNNFPEEHYTICNYLQSIGKFEDSFLFLTYGGGIGTVTTLTDSNHPMVTQKLNSYYISGFVDGLFTARKRWAIRGLHSSGNEIKSFALVI